MRKSSLSMIRSLLLASSVLATATAGAAYPEGPVTLVVGAAPGASGDLVARLLADKLSAEWKKPVVVENKSGASGMLATSDVRNAPADGYKIYISNDSAAINEVALPNKGFAHLDVFAPVSLLVLIDFKLVVNSALPVKSVAELIAHAKAAPGKLNYASSGQFTPHHLMAESFKLASGIDVVHVPYRGTAPAVMAVLGGDASFAFSGFSAVDEQIKAGRLRALGSTGKQRNAGTPDLPTIGETVPGFSAASWWAMWVRKEVPQSVRDTLRDKVRAIIADPAVARQLRNTGLEPIGGTPAELAAFLDEEVAKLRKLPKAVYDKKD